MEEDYPEPIAMEGQNKNAIEIEAYENKAEELRAVTFTDAIYSIAEGIMSSVNTLSNMTNNIAASAGDDDKARGKRIWSKAFTSHAKQSGDSKFKVRSGGGQIGTDIDIIEDKFILGAAFTKATTNAKMLGASNIKASANIWSLYSRYNISNNFVMDGDLSYGALQIKGLETDRKNNNGNLFKTSITIAHKIRLSDNSLIIMPKAGIAYDATAARYKKHDIKANNLSNNIGLSIGAAGLKLGDTLIITPSIHGGAKHIISQKKSKARLSYGDYGREELTSSYKSPKDIYNIGAALEITKNQNITLAIGYDCNFRKQYKSHSGFMKLEVKF